MAFMNGQCPCSAAAADGFVPACAAFAPEQAVVAQFKEQGGLLIDLFEALLPNVSCGDRQKSASEDFSDVGDEAEAVA